LIIWVSVYMADDNPVISIGRMGNILYQILLYSFLQQRNRTRGDSHGQIICCIEYAAWIQNWLFITDLGSI